MNKIKAFFRAILPTRDFIFAVVGFIAIIAIAAGFVLGLTLGINYVLVHTIGTTATDYIWLVVMIVFWGWLLFGPLVEIIIHRYRKFMREYNEDG